MGPDKNQYIPEKGYSIPTKWCINVHVRLSVRQNLPFEYTQSLTMDGRSVDKKDEILTYIQARSKLGCSLKQLMTEISTALWTFLCVI